MDLLQLRYFCTVAKLGNVSKAAAHHNIPQPAMSITISRLEKELGIPLFDRHKNRIMLNQSGHEFLTYIEQSLGLIDEAVNRIRSLSNDPEGELNIYVSQRRSLIVNCIAAFHKIYPKILITMSSDSKNLENLSCDLYISSKAPKNEKFDEVVLSNEDIYVVLSKKHPLAKRESLQLSDLKSLSFIVPSIDSSCYTAVNEICKKHGFAINVVMFCEMTSGLKQFVADGIGASFFVERALKGIFMDDGTSDKFVFLKIESPEVYRNTSIFYQSDKPLSANARIFFEFLKKYYMEYEQISDSII